MKKSLLLLAVAAGTLSVSALTAKEASAHGYVQIPAARGYQGFLDKNTFGWSFANQLYGSVIDNPQGLEAPKGFPEKGPADGKIASANGALGTLLDRQTSQLWKKQEIKTGVNTLTWRYTAAHSTSKWHYYMTKVGWDQNTPLTRDELQLIGTIDHDGSTAANNLSHQITVPSDRSGYHVILAVWDVADTPNAFYNVIDVNVTQGNSTTPSTPELPQTPKNLKADHLSKNSVELSWEAQTATEFEIYRDGVKIAETKTAKYEDKTVSPSTKYAYQVKAKNDQGESPLSAKLEVETPANTVAETPTAPSGLHSMGVTKDSVDLMFSRATHSQGIKEYQIYRNGVQVATTTATRYTDKDLNPSTTYDYQVVAVANNGEKSQWSNLLKITTASSSNESSNESSSDNREFKLGSFFSPQTYKSGELVQHKGKTYQVKQTHKNYGDSNWAPDSAQTLFTEKK